MRTLKTFFVFLFCTILLTGIVKESKAQLLPKTYVNVSLQNVPPTMGLTWNAQITMHFVGINYTQTIKKVIPGGTTTDFTYVLDGYSSYTGTIVVAVKLNNLTTYHFLGTAYKTGTWNSADKIPIIVNQWLPVID